MCRARVCCLDVGDHGMVNDETRNELAARLRQEAAEGRAEVAERRRMRLMGLGPEEWRHRL